MFIWGGDSDMSKKKQNTNKRREVKNITKSSTKEIVKGVIESPAKKIVITGIGRAGTSVLMWLLTELKLDTGFSLEDCQTMQETKWLAGLEKYDLVNGPYIIKNPQYAHQIDKVHDLIEHAIIPMRDIKLAAQSRVNNGVGRGGLWEATDLESQIEYLETISKKMFNDLTEFKVPYTTIDFPRFTLDPEYCYEQLQYIVSDIDYDKFLVVHTRIMDPDISIRTKN